MALKGKIKKTVVAGYKVSGIVTSSVDRAEFEFDQTFGVQLGLKVGSVVQYEFVTVDGKVKAVSLDPVDKGIVETIDGDGSGIIAEANGTKIDFKQDYAKELGIVVGLKVKYVVLNVDGKYIATSLKPIDA